MPNSWYSYNGTGDIFLANNYRLMTDKPGCAVGTVICAIFAPEGGRTPISPLPESIQTYLSNARATLVPQPQGIGSRKYVYLRPNF